MNYDSIIAHQHDVVNFANQRAKKLSKSLSEDQAEINREIEKFVEAVNNRGAFTFFYNTSLRKLKQLLKRVKKIRDESFGRYGNDLLDEIKEFISVEKTIQAKIFDVKDDKSVSDILPYFLTSVIVQETFSSGLETLKASDFSRLKKRIQAAVALKKDAKEIIKDVEDAINTTETKATSFGETSFLSAKTTTSLVAASASVSVLMGKIVAVLDSRTSVTCRVLNGTVGKYLTMQQPPYHFNCRSVVIPFVGKAPESESYADWINRQPPEVQDAAVGKTRAKLLRDGILKLEKFYYNNEAVTLNELSSKYTKVDEYLRGNL